MAYKKDVGDVRESPALDILELLIAARRRRCRTAIRMCRDSSTAAMCSTHVAPADALRRGVDCIVICTDHSSFDWKPIVSSGDPDRRHAATRCRGFRPRTIVPLSGRTLGSPQTVL